MGLCLDDKDETISTFEERTYNLFSNDQLVVTGGSGIINSPFSWSGYYSILNN